MLRHFLGSTAAGNPSSVGWSWKPQAEKSIWSLSRPQGFQNIWYPWAGSTHLQHIAFPVTSTPFQKSHNCFYSDLAQFSSLKRHGCENTNFWTVFEIMILFIVSKLSFNHTSKTAKEINLTELHKLLHSAFICTQRKRAHAAQNLAQRHRGQVKTRLQEHLRLEELGWRNRPISLQLNKDLSPCRPFLSQSLLF